MHLKVEEEKVTPPAPSPDSALSSPITTRVMFPEAQAWGEANPVPKLPITLNIWGTWSFGDGIPMRKSMTTMMTMVRKTAKSLIVDRTWGGQEINAERKGHGKHRSSTR